jgi:hypothetical protein
LTGPGMGTGPQMNGLKATWVQPYALTVSFM